MNYSKITNRLLAFICLVALAFPAGAQLVNCNVFLQGRYVEVGINISGAFGSSERAPAGYHARGGISLQNTCSGGCSGSLGLGFIADAERNGWTVGTPNYIGDYFLPGDPQEGWSLKADGVQYDGWNRNGTCGDLSLFTAGLTGTNTGYSVIGNKRIGVWQGVTPTNLSIRQTTSLDTGDVFFTMSITLTNNSSTTKNNIYYMRTVDPDQEVATPGGGSYVTNNTITYQLPNALNATLVSASGIVYGAGAYVGLGTLDCRAKCFFINGASPTALYPTPECDALYNETSATVSYTGSISADRGIGICFNLGSLAPGDSVTFAYAYILNPSDITRAFEATSPNWTATGDTASIHSLGDTAVVCQNTLTTVTITNPGDYFWTWYSLSGDTLSTLFGPSTQVRTDTSIIRLMAVGTGSCTGVNDTLYLNLNPIKPLPNNPTAGSNTPVCEGTALNLTSTTTTTGATYGWVGPNSFGSGLQNPVINPATLAAAGVYTVYAYLNLCPSMAPATTSVTVNPMPAVITGNTNLCLGQTSTISTASTGGIWTSSNTAVASINSSGVVTSVATGTSLVSYTFTSTTNCTRTATVTVNPVPDSVSGVNVLCVGTSATLSTGSTGGSWVSSNTAVATVGTGSGIVRGVAGGTVTISYRFASGCSSTKIMTVYPTPGTIAGTTTVCQGRTVTLSNSVTGGTWTSGNTSVATIGTSSGIVTGVNAGTTSITYTLAAGCTAVRTVTVNLGPAVITGITNLCTGTSDTAFNTTAGGTWSSSSTSIATIGATSGILSAVAQGTATISYTLGNGCFATTTVTVNLTPGPISGTASICAGASTTLTNISSGGSWISSNTAVATVGTGNGVVNGLTTGTTTITYTVGAGCFVTRAVTINETPGTISPSGAVTLCVGSTQSLSNATAGGTWSSTNTSVGTVGGASGVVGAVAAGTTTISYTTVNGCAATKTISVAVTPVAITPSSITICQGTTGTLSNAVPGGTWQSGNTAIATIGTSNGAVAGVAGGTAAITYTIGSCSVFASVSVTPLPATISPSGAVSVCVGTTSTLSNTTTGGTWGSSNAGVGTIGAASGIVSGVSPGTTTISYTVSGCSVTKVVNINVSPAAISPSSAAVCVGAGTGLSNSTSGGTWSSSNTGIATVSSTGNVSGVTAGTVTISYSIGSCFTVATVTVNPIPAAINPSGAIRICGGATTTLSHGTSGGTWSSGSTSLATVGVGTGIVTGVASGVVNISYTLNGCAATKTITISVTPAPISPSGAAVCVGFATTFTNTVNGGAWSSSNTAVATIGTGTAVVNALSAGTSTITYTIGTCFATATVTVNPLPVAGTIGGATAICVGGTTSMSATVAGGRWSSSSASATVGTSSGVVTGVSAGSTTISYTVTNSCGTVFTTRTLTVVASGVAAISGPATMCAGTTITLSSITPGGTWASSNGSGSITSGGLLTGISMGLDTITYTVTNVCGTASTTKTISIGAFLTAGSISGASTVCQGATLTLSNLATGGVWSTANSTATVNTTGVVTGVSGGTNTISYTVTASCGSAWATKTITAVPTPNAGSIIGLSTICAGNITTYTNAATGGVWSVTNTLAVITGIGTLTAISPGLDTIRYTVTNSCGTAVASRTLSIGAFLTAGTISGPSAVCQGSTITLTDPSPGGTWSARVGVATVSTTGVVGGVTNGIDTIAYTVTSACGSAVATRVVTVTALPNAGTISGASFVCAGATITMSNTVTGGTWSAANATATVSSAGEVTGVSSGTNTISYTYTNTCGTATTTATLQVGIVPTVGTITGPSNVCLGTPITLSNSVSGGAWSAALGNVTITGGGIVNGIVAGMDTIHYTVTNACGTATATVTLSITPVPDAGTISGAGALCVGSATTFSNTVSGGVWSTSSAGSVASVSTIGVVTAIAAGSDAISYTVTNACGSASAIGSMSVTAVPVAGTISGPSSVCISSPITLSASVAGGAWSAVNGRASVTSAGIVTGSTVGIDTIIYTVTNSCGTASASHSVAISTTATAGTIVGLSTICAGTTTTYTNATSGGAWSNASGIGSITAGGIYTATSVGIDTVRYTVTNGCGTAIARQVVTIGAALSAGTISGAATVCTGATTTLSSSVSGGAWTVASGGSTATINTSGILAGVATGIETVSYTVTSSCGTATATHTISVSPAPVAGSISGNPSLCIGITATYTNTATGGAWSTASGGTITSITGGGIATPVAVGADVISYTATTACGSTTTTFPVTVSPAITAGSISGASIVCTGASISLSASVSGGVWSVASGGTVANINTSGILNGVAAGIETVSYTVSSACGSVAATRTVTVSLAPDAGTISGFTALCSGFAGTYTSTVGGGSWSTSSGGAIASISTGGIATPVAVGSDVISYTVITGCGSVTAIYPISVIPVLDAGSITGPSTVCGGSTITLANTAPGGVWSIPGGIASISSSGVVTGLSGGIATVSYTVASSCGTAAATTTVTVSPLPVAGSISGVSVICAGLVTTLSNSAGGGTWSSGNTAIATVGASGDLVAVSPGSVTISYTVTNSCGTAVATHPLTVGVAIVTGTISGPAGLCAGATITMSTTGTGGTWSVASGGSRSTVSSAGVVTGLAAGTDIVSYTVSSGCGSASATQTITISAPTGAGTITGPSLVCVGSVVTLGSTVPGGVWSASNGNATITTAGLVTGVATGLDTIRYTVSDFCGVSVATSVLTISPLPGAGTISGPGTVCGGATITLTNTTAGGIWTSANPTVAAIGSTSGIVSGVSGGTSIISYVITSSCGTSGAVSAVTVLPLPSAGTITGPAGVCVGATISLSNTATGGFWSSSNTAIASVSSTGIVNGISSGAAVISYIVSNSCGSAAAAHLVTVLAPPVMPSIAGATSACPGGTVTLSNTLAGGTWASSDAAVANIGSSNGVVSAVSAGIVSISYSASNICGTTTTVRSFTVNPLPNAGTITGTDDVCIGSTLTLSNAAPGGVWSVGSTHATIATTGVVTAVSAGAVPVSYTVTNSCGTARATTTINVVSFPSAGTITGPTSVCEGAVITLTSGAPGGVWLRSNATAAIIAPGIVQGVTAGVDSIFYVVSNACGTSVANAIITIHGVPTVAAITGSGSHCVGTTVTFANATTGGTWSSSDAAIATVASSGAVTGLSGGIATISYTVFNSLGCSTTATATDTVVPVPVLAAITGSPNACIGFATTLSNSFAGGTWSSSDASIATIDATTGVVNGVMAGTATITYTVVNICGAASATIVQTVHPLPTVAAIAGPASVCEGATVTLTNATTGGVWASGDTTIATIAAGTGILRGVTTGVANITYAFTSSFGCTAFAVATHTVHPAPFVAPITGTATQCVGATSTLFNATTGGTWSSSNTAVASVDAAGVVRGNAAGTATIRYTVTGSLGCTATAAVSDTVFALPTVAPITGAAVVCAGASITMSSTTTGGAWTSSSTGIASVDASGIVTGIAAGTATISYRVIVGTGCSTVVTAPVAVQSLPSVAAISGPTDVCAGFATTLSSATMGGIWSSSNATIAPIGSSSGIVTGLVAGTATMQYTVTSAFGCVASVSHPFTVNPIPVVAAISGIARQCPAAATTLSSATPGGLWSSSNVTVATVNSVTGVVTGGISGTATISYLVTSMGCSARVTIADTVLPLPVRSTISGLSAVCLGGSATLSSPISGGVWSSANPTIATIGSGTGIVVGTSAGTVNIYNTRTNDCGSISDTATFTVHPLPAAGPITGSSTNLCAGATITLTGATAGGTWTSSNTAVASIGTAGVVSGLSTGTTTITYRVVSSAGCANQATIGITVDGVLPTGSITPAGSATLCHGSPVSLSVVSSGSGLSYQWLYNTSMIPGATSSMHVAVTSGVFSAIITNGSCSRTLAGTTIIAPPSPVITFTMPDVLSTAGGFAAYQWHLDGTPIAGATTNVTTKTGSGIYTVDVTDVNGCKETSAGYIALSAGNVVLQSDIKVYPNPASDVLHVQAPVPVNITILSVDGKVLITAANTTSVDVSKLPSGIYLVMVYSEDQVLLKTAKFSKVD